MWYTSWGSTIVPCPLLPPPQGCKDEEELGPGGSEGWEGRGGEESASLRILVLQLFQRKAFSEIALSVEIVEIALSDALDLCAYLYLGWYFIQSVERL